MIVTARQEHLADIKALWQEAFGDDPGYIDLFLRERGKLSHALVFLEGGRVGGMLFLLPCRLVFGAASYRCAYICGVAVLRSLRGRGIASALLEHAHGLCARRGYDVCALVPADPPLFGYYAARGYAVQGYVNSLTVEAESLNGPGGVPVFSDISCQEVLALRKDFFAGAYLEWGESAMDFFLRENALLGGSFYRYTLDGREDYLCCIPSGDRLLVREFAGEDAHLFPVLSALTRRLHTQSCLVRLSPQSALGERVPLAMTKWLRGEGCLEAFYLSHVLD